MANLTKSFGKKLSPLISTLVTLMNADQVLEYYSRVIYKKTMLNYMITNESIILHIQAIYNLRNILSHIKNSNTEKIEAEVKSIVMSLHEEMAQIFGTIYLDIEAVKNREFSATKNREREKNKLENLSKKMLEYVKKVKKDNAKKSTSFTETNSDVECVLKLAHDENVRFLPVEQPINDHCDPLLQSINEKLQKLMREEAFDSDESLDLECYAKRGVNSESNIHLQLHKA